MFDSLLDNVNAYQKGLDATWLRNNVISNNIANADTKNFKASKVSFENLFKDALEEKGIVGKTTHPKHFKLGAARLDSVKPEVTEKPGIVRMDGNNVDIEVEMSDLARNTIQYNYLVQKISREISGIKFAISEGR